MRIDSHVNGSPLRRRGRHADLAPTRPRCRDVVARGLAGHGRPGRRGVPRRQGRRRPAWAATPAPVRGQVIAKIGRLVEANAEALAAAGHPRGRQADRRGARRGAGDRRHLRLLPRRGPPALRPDRPERDARQAAVHLPRAGRRRRHHHGGQLPRRGAVLVPRAGAALRQRRRVEAGRVRRRPRRRADPHLRRGRPARRACSTPCTPTGPSTYEGLEKALEAGLVQQDRLHRLVRGRRAHRRAGRPPPAERLPRARRQEPARRHARRRPRPRRRGRAVLRLRHRRPALHLAGRRDRARRRLRRLPGEVPRPGRDRRRRRPDRRLRPVRPDARRALPATASRSGSARCSRTTRCTARPAPVASRRRTRATASSATRTRACSPTRRSSPACAADDALYRNETFGPLVSVMRFSTFDEAVELANGHGYGLSSAIYTPRRADGVPLPRARVAPGCCRSTTRRRAPRRTCPSAGTARAATARASRGVWVLDQFTRWQSMNWDYAGKLQKAQMDTEVSTYDAAFRLLQTPCHRSGRRHGGPRRGGQPQPAAPLQQAVVDRGAARRRATASRATRTPARRSSTAPASAGVRTTPTRARCTCCTPSCSSAACQVRRVRR